MLNRVSLASGKPFKQETDMALCCSGEEIFILFVRCRNQAINFRNCKRQLGVKLKEKHYCLLACNEHSVHIFIISTFSFCVAINVLK